MQQGGAEGKQAVGREGQLSGANFGPKYEAHVQEMQKQLDDSRSRWACQGSRLLSHARLHLKGGGNSTVHWHL